VHGAGRRGREHQQERAAEVPDVCFIKAATSVDECLKDVHSQRAALVNRIKHTWK
jgi:hypothetical protein